MSNPPQEMTPDELDEMSRRVRKIGLIVLISALIVIGLSSLTLKADQVNQLPRVEMDPVQETPVPVE